MGIQFDNLATNNEQRRTAGQTTDKVFTTRVNGDASNNLEILASGAITAQAITAAGVLTATGGVVRTAITAATCPVHVNSAPAPTLTTGTDTAPTAGTIYGGQVFIPSNMTLTGVGFLIGSVGGTDDVIVSLYDSTGALVANSDLTAAAPTVGSTATYQQVAFTATYAAKGPGLYYVGVSVNGTTCRLRLSVANGARGIAQAGVYATLAAIASPPTANAAAIIGYVY